MNILFSLIVLQILIIILEKTKVFFVLRLIGNGLREVGDLTIKQLTFLLEKTKSKKQNLSLEINKIKKNRNNKPIEEKNKLPKENINIQTKVVNESNDNIVDFEDLKKIKNLRKKYHL